MSDILSTTLRLPCGAVLPNRLSKAAMTEGVADSSLRATPRHQRLYRTWSEGGCGMLLTGNVQVDRADLERPGNVAIDRTQPRTYSPEARASLSAWAKAGTVAGNHLWMQIAHAGRQTPRYVTNRPRAPSAVQLDLLGNYARPVALTEAEVLDLIGRFAHAATVARETGFTGVQVHGAHGYLISSFLSPVTNLRTDAWGGTLENRARFLLEAVRAVRQAVGRDFPVSVKLNSDDFRKGGFSSDESLQVVRWLNDESLDLLEVSGGTYEQPRLIGFEGRSEDAMPVRPSTRAREAYFLEYAAVIRQVARMPLMVTGGFRTRKGMEDALTSSPALRATSPAGGRGKEPSPAEAGEGASVGATATTRGVTEFSEPSPELRSTSPAEAGEVKTGDCDVVGLGRPLCWQPDFARRLLAREAEGIENLDARLRLAQSGWLSPTSRYTAARALNAFGAQAWYYCQLFRLADGRPADLDLGVFSALREYLADELQKAWRLHRAYRK
jgi:2,4-dienoyl-CoA reductase-like NADH-dependent reductase (Old Yellow Enzyme family)